MSIVTRATVRQSTAGAGYCAKGVRTSAFDSGSFDRFLSRSHVPVIQLMNGLLLDSITQGGQELEGGRWTFETLLINDLQRFSVSGKDILDNTHRCSLIRSTNPQRMRSLPTS